MFRRFAALPAGALVLIFYTGISVFGQSGEGTTNFGKGGDKKDTTVKKPTPAKPPDKKSPSGSNLRTPPPPTTKTAKSQKPTPNSNASSEATNDCAESEILIKCDSPECSVLIDGKSQGIANINGELRAPITRGKRNVEISKNGFETRKETINVSCGELKQFDAKLKPKPFDIKIKTNLSSCDILVNGQLVGKSDENGFYNLSSKGGTVLVEAKKAGYLAESVSISPAMAQKEILLQLKPIPARVILSTNVSGAFAQVEGDEKKYDVTEAIPLEPKRQKLTVMALGYKPFDLDLDLKPNQKVEKTINLELLPVTELINQAENFLKKKLPTEAQQLCKYILATQPDNAVAHRLLGSIYLDRQDYAQAEPHLLKAIDGNETVELKIRRHYNEKFELNSAQHGAVCEARLLLSKNEVEYQGSTATAENFKVPYTQFQIIGLQIKKGIALALSLKVADSKGKTKDYNFFGLDKELSQEGKPYLEMIQRIITQKHKT